MKVYLSVPFKENNQAKALGARWDPNVRQWYAPNGEKELIQRWPTLPPIMNIPGEDRNFEGNRLFVDLVPKTCWFTNVRTCVEPSDWDRLRKYVYERANNRCECCNEKAVLEAHERWHFNNETKVQKLMRIIALCKSCHEVTHIGLAKKNGRAEEATKHLMKVTGMNDVEANKHINDAFALWHERNKFVWELDLSIITESGIQLSKRVEAQERSQISKETILQFNKTGTAPEREIISLPQNKKIDAKILPQHEDINYSLKNNKRSIMDLMKNEEDKITKKNKGQDKLNNNNNNEEKDVAQRINPVTPHDSISLKGLLENMKRYEKRSQLQSEANKLLDTLEQENEQIFDNTYQRNSQQ